MNSNYNDYRVLAPSVHFLAFNLQESEIIKLKANRRQVSKDWLWQTCDKIVSSVFQQNFLIQSYLDLKKQPHNFFVTVINPNCLDNKIPIKDICSIPNSIPLQGQVLFKRKSFPIEGFVYPVRINNSYGLWLNCGYPKQQNGFNTEEIDIRFIRQLNPDNCFDATDKKGYSGQAIIITAWLVPEDIRKSQQELKEIADECLKNFFPDGYNIPPFNRVGELFGSPVFQYGLEKELPSSGNIFVCLFRSYKTPKRFHQSHLLIFNLFFYRAQIIKNFQDVRRNSCRIEKMHTKIVGEINSLFKLGKNNTLSKDDLNKLQLKLKVLPLRAHQYEEFRATLNISKNQIDRSVNNYKSIVEKIAEQFEGENLSFLETLSNTNWPFYQERIEANLIYFEHGSKLIDNAVSSIRGQIAIEQTELSSRRLEVQEENDRTLQQRITALGFGLSVGGILSQIIANEKFAPPFIVLKNADGTEYAYYYIVSTIFCVVVGFICAFIVDRVVLSFPWVLDFSFRKLLCQLFRNKN
ncbi:MAG: hypothetical protein IGS39_25105 [Calothrix sp. C42_A2020_038]|nr:hypothetical protein [Calothrix sp. C42_A2020_038]